MMTEQERIELEERLEEVESQITWCNFQWPTPYRELHELEIEREEIREILDNE